MAGSTLQMRRSEFADFVWNHAVDAFQARFDTRAKLAESEVELLRDLLNRERLASPQALATRIKEVVAMQSEILPLLLQMAGLTRNKILQDIKAYARNAGRRVPLSSPRALFNSEEGATLAADYVARQFHRVYGHCGSVTPATLEAVSQATWPGYVRQERAKRMGHEAEYRLACMFRDLGLPFAPAHKAENPLGRDVRIGGISYDLVSPSEENALLRVKATVHTANIGQYGESKDDLEIRQASTAIRRERRRTGAGITLLAFVDGVGFESNRAGLDGVLTVTDEFCQFRTLWKAAAIAGAKCGKPVTVTLPPGHVERFRPFAEKYGAALRAAPSSSMRRLDGVQAGDGCVQPLPRS